MLVYLLIPGGIVLFVRPLQGENGTVWQAFGWGALIGLVLYGVYDLTNLAVLEKWTVRMTLADMTLGLRSVRHDQCCHEVRGWLADEVTHHYS